MLDNHPHLICYASVQQTQTQLGLLRRRCMAPWPWPRPRATTSRAPHKTPGLICSMFLSMLTYTHSRSYGARPTWSWCSPLADLRCIYLCIFIIFTAVRRHIILLNLRSQWAMPGRTLRAVVLTVVTIGVLSLLSTTGPGSPSRGRFHATLNVGAAAQNQVIPRRFLRMVYQALDVIVTAELEEAQASHCTSPYFVTDSTRLHHVASAVV